MKRSMGWHIFREIFTSHQFDLTMDDRISSMNVLHPLPFCTENIGENEEKNRWWSVYHIAMISELAIAFNWRSSQAMECRNRIRLRWSSLKLISSSIHLPIIAGSLSLPWSHHNQSRIEAEDAVHFRRIVRFIFAPSCNNDFSPMPRIFWSKGKGELPKIRMKDLTTAEVASESPSFRKSFRWGWLREISNHRQRPSWRCGRLSV